MRRFVAVMIGSLLACIGAAPAWACGGLLAPNGSVQLLKTSTFVGYVDGVEHYVTSFSFAGGGAKFGSIVPLPGIPTNVRKGGDWTLQRLVQEVQPPVFRNALAADTEGAASKATVLMEKQIDSLKVTILEGGGDEVGRWAKENGFNLPPDAPEVLDFYAERSPIFMAARFDRDDALARGFQVGDGTPVHLTIPTDNPWVPLRVLGLGKQPKEQIEADVFILTEGAPAMLPRPLTAEFGGSEGLVLERQQIASPDLLRDLRSDRGMKWLPREGMWFSYIQINSTAGELTHDLAMDVTGVGEPSPVAAGLTGPWSPALEVPAASGTLWAWALAAVLAGAILYVSGKLAPSNR